MGKEFITGYTSFIDGEKDPRNLLVAFAIARVILIEFDVTEHVEVCVPTLVSFRKHETFLVSIQHNILLLPDHISPSA